MKLRAVVALSAALGAVVGLGLAIRRRHATVDWESLPSEPAPVDA